MTAQTLFLTDEELRQLTGYQRNADQRNWLATRGWRFEVSAIGKAIVSRQHAEKMLAGAIAPGGEERNWQPNRAALRRAA
jgi:hypothetical protein